MPDGDVLLSAEKHDAMFDRTYHWIPYAATDVLNLEKNEGRYFDDELNILLGGGELLFFFFFPFFAALYSLFHLVVEGEVQGRRDG